MLAHFLSLALSILSLSPQQVAPAPVPAPAPAPVLSTIGGTPVPYGLDCEEDEVIYFTGPDTLDCVHADSL